MDFARVVRLVGGFLQARGAPHAVIGGFAMHAYGRARATIDLDFVVPAEVQPALVEFLEANGYETLHVSAGYSNHLHWTPELGRVDFVYTSGETTNRLFGSTTEAVLAGVSVRVPRPEHLAAMKILAMKNDPDRTIQEMADIQCLLDVPGVDAEEVGRYFRQHGMEDRFEALRRTR